MHFNNIYHLALLSSLAAALPSSTAAPQKRQEGCTAKYDIGGNVAYLVISDTMNAGLSYAGSFIGGTVIDPFNCTIDQDKVGASDTTVWTGDCTNGYGFAVTGVRSPDFRAELDFHNGQPPLVFAFETVKDDIYA